MTASVLPAGVQIAGAIDVERGEGHLRPWRLPVADLELHHPDLLPLAAGPCGVRLRFRTRARGLFLDAAPVVQAGTEAEALPYDLCVDGELHTTVTTPPVPGPVGFTGLPAGDKEVELWLPQLPGVRLFGLRAEDGAEFHAPRADDRPRWIVHGSSITHGLETTPSRTWPAVAAHLLGRNLTNLGYSGQCHLDPLVARMIAARPAEHITLKLGINVHNRQSMRERAFTPAVRGFLAAVRDARPETPITVVSPIHSPSRETSALTVIDSPEGEAESVGDLALVHMRELLAETVELLRRRGDRNLHYLDGRKLFGPDDLAHLPDGLHPDAEGLRLMGERYAAAAAG